jgi:hypothetical protein
MPHQAALIIYRAESLERALLVSFPSFDYSKALSESIAILESYATEYHYDWLPPTYSKAGPSSETSSSSSSSIDSLSAHNDSVVELGPNNYSLSCAISTITRLEMVKTTRIGTVCRKVRKSGITGWHIERIIRPNEPDFVGCLGNAVEFQTMVCYHAHIFVASTLMRYS